MTQLNLHRKVPLAWAFINILMLPTFAQTDEKTGDPGMAKNNAPLPPLNAYEDTLNQIIGVPGAFVEMNLTALQDSLSALELAIRERLQALDSVASLFSNSGARQIIGQDSALSALIKNYAQFTSKYNLPAASLPEASDLLEKLGEIQEPLGLQAPSGVQWPKAPVPEIPDARENLNKLAESQGELTAPLDNEQNLDEVVGRRAQDRRNSIFRGSKVGFARLRKSNG